MVSPGMTKGSRSIRITATCPRNRERKAKAASPPMTVEITAVIRPSVRLFFSETKTDWFSARARYQRHVKPPQGSVMLLLSLKDSTISITIGV